MDWTLYPEDIFELMISSILVSEGLRPRRPRLGK
jgi:hypothetical protein